MEPPLPRLTRAQLQVEAAAFAKAHARHNEPALLWLDYPAIDAYYLHRFKAELAKRYKLPKGPSKTGILFPGLKVEVLFINDRLNDSYCSISSGTQMIQGLGYDVLLFVYHQQSDFERGTVWIDIRKAIWVSNYRTADWYSTLRVIECLEKSPLLENVLACFDTISLPVHPGEVLKLAKEILEHPPKQGYAAMGRAMQWHMRWGRIIDEAGKVDGIRQLE